MSRIESLKKLGLTRQEAEIYVLLLSEGSLSAKVIAQKCRIFPSAVYRIIYRLSDKELIEISSKTPLRYILTPVEFALNNLVTKQKEQLDASKRNLLKFGNVRKAIKETDLELSKDKKRFFNESERLIEESKQEVLIISIGEPTTPELILADKKAIERGVKIKFIIHKYDLENQDLIHNLVRNGLEIRYLRDWGYHLQIVDGKKCLLSINNPRETDERVNIKIQSKYLSKAFRNYFYSLWKKAEPVNI